ncbi:Pycsar system effector family protein [Streptomyces sp. NPDC050804]|uniref:Pycsar system effector family protein n=1 Tax=Streptomyces sp. NPDC050804 TaxID=3154745 RepID=UPI0034385584
MTDTPPLTPPKPLAERLLAELRVDIARADSKASVLVAALGMTAGVFSGLLAGGVWAPDALSALATITWWTGTLTLVLALFALLMAVLPRYRTKGWAPGQPLSYFGDIHQAARSGRLETALIETERTSAAALVVALTETSRIAARKHQWIRVGLIAFCSGAVLIPGSLLIG